MGIVFRQSVKTTIVNFAGALLGALIVFISPQIFSQQQYGFTKNVNIEGAIAHLLTLMGTASLAYTFTQRYAGKDERKKVLVAICSLVPLAATVVLTIPYLMFRNDVVNLYQPGDRNLVNRYYLWVPVLVLLWSFMNFIEQYLISQVKVAAAAFTREVLLRLVNILFIVLYFLHWISFHDFIVYTVLMYTIPSLVMLFIAMRTEGFGISFKWGAFTRAEYKEIINYSWYNLLYGASLNIIGFVDSLMLAPLDKSGMGALAVYTIAVYIATLMVIPYRAMISAAYPILNSAYIQGEKDKLEDLFHRSGVNILIVAVAMVTLIACNLDSIVSVLPPGYKAVSGLVLILMLGRMVDMATGLNSEVIGISRYYKFNFYIAIVLVGVAIALNRILIPQYGFYGSAWSATIALMVFNIGKMIYLYRKMHLLPFTNKSWRVLFAGGISFLAVYFIPHTYQRTGANFFGLFLDAGWRSILLVVIYTSLLIILKPSIDLNEYLKTVRANKRLF